MERLEIRAICVKANEQNGEIYGLRFYDDDAKIIAEEIFDKRVVA